MRWGRPRHGYAPNTVAELEAAQRAARTTPPRPSPEVETDLGPALTAVRGPPWYLARAGVTFAAGERVARVGSKSMEDSGRVVVVAARVQKLPQGATLRLRDEKGLPLRGHTGRGRAGGPDRPPSR